MPEVAFDLKGLLEALLDHKPTSEGAYPQIVHYVPTEELNRFVGVVRCLRVEVDGQCCEVSDTDMVLHLSWSPEFSVLRIETYKNFSESPACDTLFDFLVTFANVLNINSPSCITRLSIVKGEDGINEINGVFSTCFYTAEEGLSQYFLDSAYRLFCREVARIIAILHSKIKKLREEDDLLSEEDTGEGTPEAEEKPPPKSWLH